MKRPARESLPLLFLLGLLAAVALMWRLAPRPAPAGAAVTRPIAITPFALVDGEGEPFATERLKGHWSLLLFGYTHCPDVCPTTLSELARLQRKLAADGNPIPRFLFVSLDPKRDTPAHLKAYLGYFGSNFTGVTGPRPELDRLARQLGIGYSIVPGANGDYSIDHSATLLLVDPKARRVGFINPPFDTGELANRYMSIRHFYED